MTVVAPACQESVAVLLMVWAWAVGARMLIAAATVAMIAFRWLMPARIFCCRMRDRPDGLACHAPCHRMVAWKYIVTVPPVATALSVVGAEVTF
jgi:hypothetical protein